MNYEKNTNMPAEAANVPESPVIDVTGLEMTAGIPVGGSGDIRLCPDGKYRWYYEYPMLLNPTILYTVWKVMMISALFPALVVFFSSLSEGFLKALLGLVSVLGITFGIMFVLSWLAYFILAACYGFKYIVLFTMDEQGVVHAQQNRQFKKAQAIGWLTAAAGIAQGKPGVVGTGLLVSSKQTLSSTFKNVNKIIGHRRLNTIKVNQLLAKNQVYVKKEDYDFVWEYITSRCPNAKIR